MENILSQKDTSLAILDHDAVYISLQALTKEKKWKNSTFSDEEPYQIGQYASVHGPTVAVKKSKNSYGDEFKKTHPHKKFRECTAKNQIRSIRMHHFRTKYQKLLKKKKQSSKISLRKRGRPLILGTGWEGENISSCA